MSMTFTSVQEFRLVMDRVFALMGEDPEMGPKLREADVPHRFEFDDVELVVHVRATRPGEPGNLVWQWSDDVDWEPSVRMTMSAATALRYFQGKENIAMAIARRRIKVGGNLKAALAMVPVTKPVYALFRTVVDAEYPHLRA